MSIKTYGVSVGEELLVLSMQKWQPCWSICSGQLLIRGGWPRL